MTKQELIAHTIREVCEGSEMQYRSYSGRGMRGDSCAAVVVEGGISDLVTLVGWVIAAVPNIPAAEVADILSHVESDNMGYATVFYWRQMKVEYVDDSDDDEDDSDDYLDDDGDWREDFGF